MFAVCIYIGPRAEAYTRVEFNEEFGAKGLLDKYNNNVDMDLQVLSYLSVGKQTSYSTTYTASAMNGLYFSAEQNAHGYISFAGIGIPGCYSDDDVRNIAYGLLRAASYSGYPYDARYVLQMSDAVSNAMIREGWSFCYSEDNDRFYGICVDQGTRNRRVVCVVAYAE